MRLSPLALLAVLPFIAACDGNTPKAPSTAEAKVATGPAATIPSKPPAAISTKFPITARPMLGTWAADASGCTDAKLVTAVTPTSYSAGGKSCDLALADNKDGTFNATCGQQKLVLTPIFGPTGEGIRIAVGDAKPTNVFRCTK